MHSLVCGPGYTGKRVIALLGSADTTIVGRPAHDLDDPGIDVPVPAEPYVVLYTVPPSGDARNDQRVSRLLAALEPVPTRFVYLSTSGVYGDRAGAITSESVDAAPVTERALRRRAAELQLIDWSQDKNVPMVILRVPGIYGPDRLGIERLRAGQALIRESEAGPGNRIHVDDLAACCVRAMDKAARAGIFNVGDGDHRSSTWFAKTVAEMAGLSAPPEVSRAEAERTFSESRLSFLRESRKLDTTRMREALGFTPRYTDPAAGIRASLE